MKSWQQIERTNQVARSMRSMANRAIEVADGNKRAAWLFGPSGVGKSHTLFEALVLLKIAGVTPIECNPINYRDMLKHFDQTEGRRPIIFEEADVVWRSERMLNILKIATDPVREPWQRIYQGVPLTAPIFVTTNVDLYDRTEWTPALRTHGPALFRRNAPRGVTNNIDALYEYSVALALYCRLIETRVIENGAGPRIMESRPAKRRADALTWFTAQHRNLVSVSPGTLQMIAEAFDYDDAFDRELELEALMVTERKRKPVVRDDTDWLAVIKSSVSIKAKV